MTGAHTESAFEATIERHLLDHGWVQGDPKNYRRDLGFDPAALFDFVAETQPKAWQSLVGLHGSEDNARHKFSQRLAAEIDSRGLTDVLRRPVEDLGIKVRLAYFKPAHALTPELGQLYDANRVAVIRQVHYSESNPLDSVDLLLTVNGLPVATAELKNFTTAQNVEDAKRQYRKDRNPRDLLFDKRTVVHFAVDEDLVFITTRLAGEATEFLPFNQGSGGPGRPGGKGNPTNPHGYNTAYLWEQVWDRDNWLDLLNRFVYDDKATRTKKRKPTVIFPRYHQWDLVRRLTEHAAAYGPGKNYLPQHSAGSGKSNSIAWLAHRLSTLHTPADNSLLTEHAKQVGLGPNEKVFHKVVVVTDRVVLDRQLQDTIWQFDHTPGVVERIDKDSQQLADALTGAKAQIVITTLQKFPVIAKTVSDLVGSRFAVIVDEAHSSQSGESANKLKVVLGGEVTVEGSGATADEALWDAAEKFDAALEAADDPQEALAVEVSALRTSAAKRGRQDNLSFFAFTATPKYKTLELFGERIPDPATESGFRLEPFHLYSMRQAIEEEFIIDVLANYMTYSTYFRLANGLGSDDPEVEKGKANAALARFVALHPSNLAQKAEIIVKHFRAVTRKEIRGQAKAMVVTRSRLHAVRYREAIQNYLDAEHITDVRALVAFSGTVEDPDVPGRTYTETSMNGFPESETADRFQGKDPFSPGDYQVLIVAEKYQTGFDEPRLHTMYVDKKLEGVKAVQTLSRLNRKAPGKEATFVLDFANEAEDIREAFRPFYEVSWTEPTDPNILFNLRARIMDAGVIDSAEMRAMVAAMLAADEKSHEAIYAYTNAAVERYRAIDDVDEQEDFRTALRDFVRAYAWLGQIVPFTSAELEELFYYGKALLARLPKRDEDSGGLDIGDAAILTHIRTQLIGEHDLSLAEGEAEPVRGMGGGGRGAQVGEQMVRLSTLIEMLNERFGTELTAVDQVWVYQQIEAAAFDHGLRAVAEQNTEEQFGYVFDDRFMDIILDRQEANGELFTMFFDKPEFKEALTAWARGEVYRRIREGAVEAPS